MVVCGGLWWFTVVCVVVCGGLRWFVVVCSGLWYLVPPTSIIIILCHTNENIYLFISEIWHYLREKIIFKSVD